MSDGIRAARALSSGLSEETPRAKVRPASARPASTRPLSAHVPKFHIRDSPERGRIRPVSAVISKHRSSTHNQENVSVISDALKTIQSHEKRVLQLGSTAILAQTDNRPPSGRPPSGMRRPNPVFIPTRSTTMSPRKSKSPRREIVHTINATRLGMEERVGMEAETEALLIRVFHAKCLDLRLKPTDERRERFFELVRRSSTAGTLSLREAGLGALAAAAVSSLLQQKPIFQGLDLGGNMLHDLGTTAVSEMLREDRQLTSLDLKSNDIGIEGGVALFKALQTNTTLTELDLGILAGGNRNRVGSKVVSVMREALVLNTSLVTLSLYGNGLGHEGAQPFAMGLQANTILKNLDLGLNSLRDEGICLIAPALELAALESLNLANNAIGSRGIKRLAEVLSSGKLLLQTLDLSNNSISPKAALALGQALATNSLLNTLHLDKNELGADGAIALAIGMTSPSLTLLTLSCNGIHDRGSAQLAKELKRNTALTRLDLSTNQIGDTGATAIGQMLAWNTSLTSLNLEDNVIGDPGGVIVSNALFSNESLRQLSLRGNKLHDVTGAAMVAGLRGNTGLTELDISWNDVNYSNFRSIEKLISAHAAQYREGAVPRLKKELARLKKEEPKLAVREAELVEVTEEREKFLSESRKYSEERRDILAYTEGKLEETSQALQESNNERVARTADLKAATETMFEAHKSRGAELQVLQSKVTRGKAEVERLRKELEELRASIEKERQDEEETCAWILEETNIVMQEVEEKRRERDEMKEAASGGATGEQQAATAGLQQRGAGGKGGKPPLPVEKASMGARQLEAMESSRTNRTGGMDTDRGSAAPSRGSRPTSAKGSRPTSAKSRPSSAKDRPPSAKERPGSATVRPPAEKLPSRMQQGKEQPVS